MQKKLPTQETTSTNGEQSKSFSHGELEAALLDVDDVMLRCTISEDYLVIGLTGKCIKEDKRLEGDGIDVGVLNKDLNAGRKDIMRQITGQEFIDGLLTYKVGNVPVRVHVLPNDKDFFRYKDLKVYSYEDFQLPNSFDEYWKWSQI